MNGDVGECAQIEHKGTHGNTNKPYQRGLNRTLNNFV
jgi:hypothetical protein